MFVLKKCEVKSSFFLFVLLSLSASCFSYDFEGGTGEPNNPYQIATAAQLLQIDSNSNLLNKCYILLNDIDLDPSVTGIPPFTLAPIAPDTVPSLDGFQGREFTGIFDGNGKKIRNLKIDTAGAGNDYLGLFGGIYGQVRNLGIENVAIIGASGSDYLGGLCGYINLGTLSNCYSSCFLSGSYYIGGLCGYNWYGNFNNCYSSGQIIGVTSSYYLGGLCGGNYDGTFSNCYSSCFLSGSYYIGGLCGVDTGGTISNCYSSGRVKGGTGSFNLGGLCGYNLSTIINCYSSGSVTGGTYSYYLGGLCGLNYGTLSKCYSRGRVTGGTGSYNFGGLCGYNYRGMISNCYATGSVYGDDFLGGLCGFNTGTVSNCYSTGSVSGDQYKGGFCGSNSGSFTGCFWDTETSTMIDGVGNIEPDPNTVQGKTTAQMKTLSTFTDAGWDFVGETLKGTKDIWRMCVDGVQYPLLTWQFAPDFVCPDGIDIFDLEFFVSKWLSRCDQTNNFCNCTDTNYDQKVDFRDFAEFASHWLESP